MTAMDRRQKHPGHRGPVAVVVILAAAIAFFLPSLSVKLSPGIWYPYTSYHEGYGSVTYAYLGYGAVYWNPNHYWIYFGRSAIQLTNSSASIITVDSVDQNGTSIFGYFTILSDSGGRIISTGYTRTSFSTTAGEQYTVQVEGYGQCTFSHWSNGVMSSEQVVIAKSGDETLTAVYSC
jgi:hypothetical protein